MLKGNTAIELANGSYAASITGIKESLNGYQFNIKDQVLYVGTTASASNVAIKLFAPGLKNLTVTDNATINAKNFKTAGLNVLAKNNGTINLEGQYAVNKLYQLGNGRINISWIDSEKLFIDSDSKGPIYLAGIVNSMVIKLTHNAYLDARYLRAQKASVFTTDNARADVLVLDTLGAFAIDKSNIYYYKRPPHFTVVTKGKGNVLHPDWIH
ncbi:MAG: hypothetical protein ACD_21C00323G0004 [uncultured bacterium]|nr:MAG: hypothetical protein ACD_21C00323G0004 [uncultured bacterium]